MSNDTKLAARKRAGSGTSPARRLRRDGWLPGVVYGDEGAAESVQVRAHDLEMILHRHAGENLLLDLSVEEAAPVKVLLKDVQHEPVHGHLMHADFVRVSMTRKMRVGVPIRLVGDSVGVTQHGGVLEHLLRELVVECLPPDLPEWISVDVSAMEVGAALFVRDIPADPKLTVITSGNVAVATVAEQRKEEEVTPEAAAAATAEAGEPEVITAKKKEGEGEEAAAGEAGGKGEKGEKGEKAEKKEKPEKKGKEKA